MMWMYSTLASVRNSSKRPSLMLDNSQTFKNLKRRYFGMPGKGLSLKMEKCG